MKNSVGFTLSRIIGIFPFDDFGPSRKWLFISVCLRVPATVRLVQSVIIYLTIEDNLMVRIVNVLWALTVWTIPMVYLVSVSRNKEFFKWTKPVMRAETPWYCKMMFVIQIHFYTSLLVDLDWLPLNTFSMAALYVWDFIANDLMRFQYAVIITAESNRIRELRRRIKHDPTTCCNALHDIVSNSIEKVHNMFSRSMLVIMFGIAMSVTLEPVYTYDKPDAGFRVIVSILEITTESLWAWVVVHPCCLVKKQKKLKLHLLCEANAGFSILGLFTLGYPLLGSITAVATSFFGFCTSMYDTDFELES